VTNALISIKPQYVDLIMKGKKKVEIRRKALNIPSNSVLWIYSTLPSGKIEVVAKVKYIEVESPEIIWGKFSKEIGISKETYDEYIQGCTTVSAIVLKSVKKINSKPDLKELQMIDRGFKPPQFFKYLNNESPILIYLNKCI